VVGEVVLDRPQGEPMALDLRPFARFDESGMITVEFRPFGLSLAINERVDRVGKTLDFE
jgi:hypothetical protein